MNCHQSRRDAATYTNQPGSHYGPHYAPQADMLIGTNVATFGKTLPTSPHISALENACVDCHMHERGDHGEHVLPEGLVVPDDLGFTLEPRHLGRRGDGILQPAELVHELDLFGPRAREDPAVRQGPQVLQGHVPARGNLVEKLPIHVLHRFHKKRPLLLRHLAPGTQDILELAALDDVHVHADLLGKLGEVEVAHIDADAARQGPGVRVDPVRVAGDVVTARGGQVPHGHDDLLAVLLGLLDLGQDFLGRGHRSARAVHSNHDGLHELVLPETSYLLDDVIGAAFVEPEQAFRRLRLDGTVDPDNGDALLRGFKSLEKAPERPALLGSLLGSLPARGRCPEHHDQPHDDREEEKARKDLPVRVPA